MNFCNGFIFLWLALCLGLIKGAEGAQDEYDFSVPDAVYVLPDVLREISGLSYISPVALACVQDEQGILFIYDPEGRQISRQIRFGDDGDYEGLARVGKAMFVLRSDGRLLEMVDYLSPTSIVNSIETGIPAADNEGLCYDATGNRLLIAAKGKAGDTPDDKGRRIVYAFDLMTRTMQVVPAFSFDMKEIKRFADGAGIQLPVKRGKKRATVVPEIKLMTSGLCIQPGTRDIYLLSAADYLLFIFEATGRIKHIQVLSQEVFGQAEGISFNEAGDLFISNEGKGKQATIVKFSRRPR